MALTSREFRVIEILGANRSNEEGHWTGSLVASKLTKMYRYFENRDFVTKIRSLGFTFKKTSKYVSIDIVSSDMHHAVVTITQDVIKEMSAETKEDYVMAIKV